MARLRSTLCAAALGPARHSRQRRRRAGGGHRPRGYAPDIVAAVSSGSARAWIRPSWCWRMLT